MNDNVPFLFNPPLYKQRYSKVLDIISKHKPKKVVEYGCAECKLIQLMKSEEYIEEISGVDIDRTVLDTYKWKIEPLTTDYIDPRKQPLTVRLIHGSVLTFSEPFQNCDAVICIELIEHLQPSQLPGLKDNIFGFIKPKLVVISTPNSDYNVLFSTTPEIEPKMRHWDHKFEWTMKEFRSWSHEVCARYSYSVEFDGVGSPPVGKENLGFCSQFAIFHRTDNSNQSHKNGFTSIKYFEEIVSVIVHPFKAARDEESELYTSFCSCVDALSLACSSILRNFHNEKSRTLLYGDLNKSLAALDAHSKFSNSKPRKFHRKEVFPEVEHQFSDANNDCDGDGKMSRYTQNLYGQERYFVVVEPLRSMYQFLQTFHERCQTNDSRFVKYGQFDNCETEGAWLKKRRVEESNSFHCQETIVNLSQHNSSFDTTVRITDLNLLDDVDEQDRIVLNHQTNTLKIPLQFITEQEKMDMALLKSILQKERPEGIELLENGTQMLLDMETTYALNNNQRARYPSVSSSSTESSEDNERLVKFCAVEDFEEECWDCD